MRNTICATLLLGLLAALALFTIACVDGNGGSGSGNTGSDGDTDTDSDSDTDADCAADLHLQVGTSVCDFAADEVDCYWGLEQDDGLDLEVVSCGGQNDACEFEFMIVTFDGKPVDGELGLADISADSEVEGDLVPDKWVFEKTDTQLSLNFSGAMKDDSSIEVAGCIDGLPWTEGSLEEEDDDDACTSDNDSGHFYCAEITDEDVCNYIVDQCIEDEVSEAGCCAWDLDEGNCGADAEDLPCDLITDPDVCSTISAECYWEGDDGSSGSDGDADE